jgi:CheY-like chemotaxis protein
MANTLHRDGTRKLILIVDDESSILEFLEFILIDAGFAVKAAANGQEALARLSEVVPDLVILDYMMPILDGGGVIRAMRADQKYSNIPVILTSASEETTIQKRFDGYQAFLHKPYTTERLLEEIHRLLTSLY